MLSMIMKSKKLREIQNIKVLQESFKEKFQ